MAYYDKQKVIDIALGEVGYLEKETNANLDNKTGNAGDENFTKYARDLAAVKFFNGSKQGAYWCAVFVAWCFHKAFGKAAALKLLCQPSSGNCGAGVVFVREYFMKKKQWHTSNPQPGDVIVFRSSDGSTYSHTGLVYKVAGSKVYTVEGNTSGASGVVANGGGVCKKSYSVSSSRIAGYGRPAWGTETASAAPAKQDGQTPAQSATSAPAAETGGKTVQVALSVLQSGSKGALVKTLQRQLNGLGYDCGAVDGIFGSQTKEAVKALQKAKGLGADGVVGAQTWPAVLA